MLSCVDLMENVYSFSDISQALKEKRIRNMELSWVGRLEKKFFCYPINSTLNLGWYIDSRLYIYIYFI